MDKAGEALPHYWMSVFPEELTGWDVEGAS